MAFTRTAGGLSAQRVFFDAELIAYIEGKQNTNNGTIYDNFYYESIFNEFLSGKKIKIKVLGSCNDVLETYHKIKDNNISNSFAIIDRDYDGVLGSRLKDYRLIYTNGYSWENDFWSQALCQTLLSNLTMNSLEANNEFNQSISYVKRRLCFAHRVNLTCMINGTPLFLLGKKGGSDGIEINLKHKAIVTKKEMGKFVNKLRELNDRKFIAENMKMINLQSNRSIQGHYWEYVVLQMINCIAKKHSIGKTTAPHETIKTLAFSSFCASVGKYLTDQTYLHYKSSLSPFL